MFRAGAVDEKIFSILVAFCLAVTAQAATTNLVLFVADEMKMTPEEVGIAYGSGGEAGKQYLGGFPPSKAFNGIGFSTADSERWLGNISEHKTFLRFDIPPELAEKYLFELVSYDIWGHTTAWHQGFDRAPRKWIIEGKNADDTEWTLIDSQSGAVWTRPLDEVNGHKLYPVVSGERRFFTSYRFTPIETAMTGGWDVGVMEVTLNVSVNRKSVLWVTSSAQGVNCSEPRNGEWPIAESGKTFDCTSPSRFEQEGTRYELAGYSVATKEIGSDWTAPVTNAGDRYSFVSAPGQSVHLDWLWTVVSYDVSFAARRGGSVSTSGGAFAPGATIAVTATPDPGFRFVRWAGRLPEADRKNPSLSFPASAPVSLEAIFKANCPIAGEVSVEFSTTGYQGKEVLGQFPVLVRLSPERISGFEYTAVGPNGTGLYFTDEAGQVIPHEIERWDPQGESLVWVILPTVSPSGTLFKMLFGDDNVLEAGRGWVDAGYAGVWHFNEPDGIAADSTANGLDAKPLGNVANSIAVPGAVDPGRQSAIDDNGYLEIPDYDHLQLGSTFTWSGWVNLMPASGARRLFSRKNSYNQEAGWEIYIWAQEGDRFGIRGAGGAMRVEGRTANKLHDRWGHLALVYDNDMVHVYSDGELCAEGPIAPRPITASPLPWVTTPSAPRPTSGDPSMSAVSTPSRSRRTARKPSTPRWPIPPSSPTAV